MIEGGTVEPAVFREKIAHAARDLTADCYAAVAILHPAVLDDDALWWRVQLAAIRVPFCFDRGSVVTSVEVTILDQDVAARLRITAVVVWSMTVDVHVLNDDVPAEHGMDFPHWRVFNGDTVDQHVLAPIRLYELRS